MPELDRNRLWTEFLAAWPPSRVRQMTLDEYTNPNKEDAFIYWIEKRLEELGSIWGGSAFKFGIYCRDNLQVKETSGGRIWGEKYAWLSKFGATEQAAFATIRSRLMEIIDAAEEGNFARIEEVDLSPTLKWKVAFLYQDRNDPSLFPIFKKEALLLNYLSIDPRAKLGATPYHVMYETLMERHGELGDVFQIASTLWKQYEADQNRSSKAWAVPLAWTLQSPEAIEILCSKSQVEPEDVDSVLDNLLGGAEMSHGDQLALLAEGDVRALGTLTSVEPGQFSWEQTPVNFPSPLLVNPTSEVKELNASERNEIWKHLLTVPETSTASTVEPTVDVKVEPPPPPCEPQNIILYGPPGTGKTYCTVRRSLQLVLGPDKLEGLGDKGLLALFREHQARGQIEFITFHQAYGYEEFVEGLRPIMGDTGKDVHYELHDGVFKRIALRAAAEGLSSSEIPDFDQLWQRLLDELRNDGDRIAKGQSGKNYVLRPSSYGNITTFQCDIDDEGNILNVKDKHLLASRKLSKLLWEQRHSFGILPENLTYQKAVDIFQVGAHYTALWIVYNELLTLSRGQKDSLVDKAARVQQALNKPTAGRANFNFSAQNRQYVLIIDEVNRGNISKILGELITLLDADKRLGASNELKLPLSYSPTYRFAVPPNLHVLGTMNTADRSIALMDVALRRRFTFEELMPNADVIREQLRKNVSQPALIELVVDVFNTINNRIRFLYDRDHQLGHSYFLDVVSTESLRLIFVNRVIPLLQEYFYGSWDKICMVLGCPYDEAGSPRRTGHVLAAGAQSYVAPIIMASKFEEVNTLGFDHDGYEDRLDFKVRTSFQSGQLSHQDLVRTFLHILESNRDHIQVRFDELCNENLDTQGQGE